MHPFTVLWNGSVVSSYGLLSLLSIIAAGTYFFIRLRAVGVRGAQIGWYIFIGVFVQDIGGTILPYLYDLIYGIPIPRLPMTPGRWFHSIFLSMLLYTYFWVWKFKWPGKRVMDIFFLSAMIMSAVGRIGCFMAGCCGGKICDLPWALHYPDDPTGVLRHPAQLYAAFLEILIFLAMHFWDRKRRFDAQTFWRGILVYSVYRFLIGFLRSTPAVFIGLSYAQNFSVLTAILAGWVLFYRKRA